MANIIETTHSENNFDPQIYIDTIYSSFTGNQAEDGFVKFILDSLHEVFKDGKITGERILDIGTGPVCHGVYSASKWFKEIVLSDLAEENLSVLRKWKAGEVQHQKAVFKYMMKLDGDGDDWITCNRKLSDKICAIVRSDLHQSNPISGSEVENLKFDAITLVLCQNAASPTEAQYTQCVHNYSKLLKPGGHVIVIDLLGEDFYTIGQHKFKVLNANRELLQRIYTTAGYEILLWKQASTDQFQKYPPFLMVARK